LDKNIIITDDVYHPLQQALRSIAMECLVSGIAGGSCVPKNLVYSRAGAPVASKQRQRGNGFCAPNELWRSADDPLRRLRFVDRENGSFH